MIRIATSSLTLLFCSFLWAVVFGPAAFAQTAPEAAQEVPAKIDNDGLLPIIQPGFASSPEAAAFDSICPTVRIDQRKPIDLSGMESRLVCGDSKGDAIGRAWAKIPPNQAAYFMRSFLQSRGYQDPTLIQDGEVLFVRIGPRSKLSGFRILGGPDGWDPPKLRLIRGRPLTPSLLDELKSWSLSQIKNEGYACATAEVEADPETGEAVVTLSPGELKYIRAVEEVGDKGLNPGALNRYNAFRIGDRYNESLVQLTKRRVENDGFLQSLIISARCEPGHVVIVRDVVLGPSRIFRIGVGASTEEGARFRATLRRTRIGSSASSAQARINLSYLDTDVNRQTIDGNIRWYYAKGEERSYIEPRVEFSHIAERAYEIQSITASLLHGWSHEYRRGSLDTRAGPNWLQENQSRGALPRFNSIFYGEISSRWLAHDFEIFNTSPRSGEYLEGSALFTFQDWGSSFTAQKLQLTGQKLWNIFRYDPPLFVLGVRFNLSSVFSPDPNVSADLPVRFLTFLGGERDLRGFSRQSLPEDQVGALSGATGSLEGRFHRVIFSRVDVFGFLDAGYLGGAQFKLNDPLYMSPGLGFRWESPFGVLRTYVAQRFALYEPAGQEQFKRAWRFGFTYGEEF